MFKTLQHEKYDTAQEDSYDYDHHHHHHHHDHNNEHHHDHQIHELVSDNARGSVMSRLTSRKQDIAALSESERATHRELERLRASLIGRERARLYRIKKLEEQNKRSVDFSTKTYQVVSNDFIYRCKKIHN